jgi:hypothetical protein
MHTTIPAKRIVVRIDGRWSPITLVISLTAVFAAGGVLGALAVLVLGIRAEERRMSVRAKTDAATRLEAGTRRVLGVGVRNVVTSEDRSDRHGGGR